MIPKEVLARHRILKNMDNQTKEKLKREALARNNLMNGFSSTQNPENNPKEDFLNILSKVTVPVPLTELKVRNFIINSQ